MMRSLRGLLPLVALLAVASTTLRAQDSTFKGITLNGTYDPLRDKVSIAVMPVTGAFGDSVRAIVQRDLDFSDRFVVDSLDISNPSAWRNPGVAGGLNYQIFARLNAAAVVEITALPTGLHVVLHDVARGQVVNVEDMRLPSAGLSRDWRLAVHNVSDEIERWVTGQRGIAATRIAYIRGQSIRIIDSDGAAEITVPTEENGVSPSWSPDGSALVYATFGGTPKLLVMDLATGRSRTILPSQRNTTYLTPVFTPDARTVVFSRAGENGSDLFSISAAGGDTPHRLTSGQGTDNTSPTMSPDGRRIVFTSGRLGRPELYIMDADGTNVNVLTDFESSEKNYRSDPDWSPDGRVIAYQERTNDRFQIRTVRVTGSSPKFLTNEGENEQPSWAPDARHLVFTSSRTGQRQLWIMDVESGNRRQLTHSAGSRLAAWSPRLVLP
jgi:TolB protein